MILFRGPRLLLCGPYYTVTIIVLYDLEIKDVSMVRILRYSNRAATITLLQQSKPLFNNWEVLL